MPWVTLLVAVLLVANPLGLEIVGSAVRQAPTDWLARFWLWVTLAGAAAMALLGGAEIWLRRRIRRSRPQARGR